MEAIKYAPVSHIVEGADGKPSAVLIDEPLTAPGAVWVWRLTAAALK